MKIAPRLQECYLSIAGSTVLVLDSLAAGCFNFERSCPRGKDTLTHISFTNSLILLSMSAISNSFALVGDKPSS
jgi:hypothetical protein